MKDSKEYSKRVRSCYAVLKREYGKVDEVSYDDPVEALVYACVSGKATEKEARATLKRFADYFVDLNDLRVSRPEEIVELLGGDTLQNRATALTLTTALRSVFGKYNTVSLQALKKLGKKPAKQILEKMNGVNRFAVDYCMLTALHGHAIPLTDRMMDYLKRNDLVHPDGDYDQIEGFLARQVAAKNGFTFYALLRRESESGRPVLKKRTTRKTKPKSTTRRGRAVPKRKK
jgi:endonuclease III